MLADGRPADMDEEEADTLPMIPIYEKHPPMEERH
jgi:hypothetical protein